MCLSGGDVRLNFLWGLFMRVVLVQDAYDARETILCTVFLLHARDSDFYSHRHKSENIQIGFSYRMYTAHCTRKMLSARANVCLFKVIAENL